MSFGSSSRFDESLIGKATRNAINKIVEMIDVQALAIPWQGKVITTQGEDVYINAGQLGGVQVGDCFEVFRPGEKLIDPDTGLELGTVEMAVGFLVVQDNQAAGGKASKGRAMAGVEFQRGDLIRPKEGACIGS